MTKESTGLESGNVKLMNKLANGCVKSCRSVVTTSEMFLSPLSVWLKSWLLRMVVSRYSSGTERLLKL